MLALDRQAFINIIGEGQGEVGATMQPPPNGVWGMPADMLRTLPGYDPDIAKNREHARHRAKTRLRARQTAGRQRDHAKCRRLPRPGGDPDRPAQGDLY